MDIIFGGLLLEYVGNKLGLGVGNYLLSIVLMVCGIIIFYSFWFMLGIISIWFVRIYNVIEVFKNLLEVGRYLMVVYFIVYCFFFIFLVLVVFLIIVLVRVILGKVEDIWILGFFVLVGGLFFVFI